MFEFAEYCKHFPDRLKRMNFLLIVLVGIAVCHGLAFIYGTGQQSGDKFANLWIKQLFWVGIGLLLMFAVAGMDYMRIGRYAWAIYLLSVVLLITVLVFGRTINGAKSWLRLLPGVTIQPSEFAKLGLIIMISWMASRPSTRLDRIRHLFPFIVVTGIPFTLIVLQPDYGSASVLIPIAIGILFVSGIKIRWLLHGLVLSMLMSPVIYRYGLKEHQQKRIITFLNPKKDAKGHGWNARQSLLAVGSGGFSGKGFMKGTQNVLGFLPRTVAPTDFIFSVIAEETGFIGSTLLIAVFWAMMLLGLYIAMKARDGFGRNLACAVTILLCVHIYINVGMTMGMAPIIGIPLPFVSYGGSFMILMLCCVGILQSIYCHRRIRG